MEHKGWEIRAFRMAVRPDYPKPFCAVAECNKEPKLKVMFNKEGRTAEEAIEAAIREIDQGGTYERIVRAARTQGA